MAIKWISHWGVVYPAGDSESADEAHHLQGKISCGHTGHIWRPPTDVFESDDGLIIKMAVSGLRHNEKGEMLDAEILAEGDVVIIRGSRIDQTPHKKHEFYQMEIYYGCFEFHVRILIPFDPQNIRAVYRDGFLEVHVPKAEISQTGAHRVPVKSNRP